MGTVFLLAFWVYLLSAIVLGWRAGGRGDRQAIVVICAAAALSAIVHFIFDHPVAHGLVLAIDLALLAYMVRFALLSTRHWPIWFAGLHAVVCVAAFAAILVPIEMLRLDLIGGFWSIVALTVMAAGLLADQHRHTS